MVDLGALEDLGALGVFGFLCALGTLVDFLELFLVTLAAFNALDDVILTYSGSKEAATMSKEAMVVKEINMVRDIEQEVP